MRTSNTTDGPTNAPERSRCVAATSLSAGPLSMMRDNQTPLASTNLSDLNFERALGRARHQQRLRADADLARALFHAEPDEWMHDAGICGAHE